MLCLLPSPLQFPTGEFHWPNPTGCHQVKEFRSNRPQGLEQHKEGWRMQLEWVKTEISAHILWLYTCDYALTLGKRAEHTFLIFFIFLEWLKNDSQVTEFLKAGTILLIFFFFFLEPIRIYHIWHIVENQEIFDELKADHRSTFINIYKCPGHALLISVDWVMNV